MSQEVSSTGPQITRAQDKIRFDVLTVLYLPMVSSLSKTILFDILFKLNFRAFDPAFCPSECKNLMVLEPTSHDFRLNIH